MKNGVKWWSWLAAAMMAALIGFRICRTAPSLSETSVGSGSQAQEDKPITGGEVASSPDEDLRLRQEYIAKIKAALAHRADELEVELDKLLSNFRSEIEVLQANTWSTLDVGIDALTGKNGICSVKFCSKLVAVMAYDKIKDAHKTEELLDQRIEPVIGVPMDRFSNECGRRTDLMITNAIDSIRRFCEDCDGLLRTENLLPAEIAEGSPGALKNVNELFVRSRTNTKELALEQSMAAASAALEVAFLSGTIESVKTVVRCIVKKALKKPAERTVTLAVAGVGGSTADGPLPVMDIIMAVINVGGLVWSAYDINHALNVMPAQLRTNMRKDAREALSGLADANINRMDAFVADLKRLARESICFE